MFFRSIVCKSSFTFLLISVFYSSVPRAGVFVKQNGKETAIEQTTLVDVRQIDSTIRVDLKYSTTDNFIGKDVYGDLNACYLRQEVARMLSEAQQNLKAVNPELSLVVYDGLRPRSVQWTMWEVVKGTDKQKYVAYPASGSIHNYGAAVDVSIVDQSGKPIDMGTEFDFFGKLAQPRHEEEFLRKKQLSEEQIANRNLLRKVMGDAGFIGISIEWWHFNAFAKEEIKSRYDIVEDVFVK